MGWKLSFQIPKAQKRAVYTMYTSVYTSIYRKNIDIQVWNDDTGAGNSKWAVHVRPTVRYTQKWIEIRPIYIDIPLLYTQVFGSENGLKEAQKRSNRPKFDMLLPFPPLLFYYI
uniref:Putative ovule protein n=1 Tax=Solanum chacoense TaxID=4108 RepID=A0A0V0IGD9_SOLCH